MQQLRHILIFIFCLGTLNLQAQSGGNAVYSFLNLTGSARAAGLGGNAIATYTEDISLVYQNPALLQTGMHNHLGLNFAGIKGGITFGDVAYARDFHKTGMFSANLHFISYGDFERRTVENEKLGEFTAGEYAMSFSWSKALDSSLFLGIALKGIYSDFDEATSTGVAADAGLTWFNNEKQWTASLVFKNLGRQLGTYYGEREDLPFEIQAGVSKKLKNAPFRFSFIAQQLQKWDLTYDDPAKATIDPLTGEKELDKITSLDKMMRHVILNTELILSKGFQIRLGYNFLRRSELGFEQKRGLAGFTAGFGIRVNRFHMGYARSVFNSAGGINTFSVSTDLASF